MSAPPRAGARATDRGAVTTRRATPGDAAELAAVHLASWHGAYRDDAPPGWLAAHTLTSETAAWAARLTAVPPPLVLVARMAPTTPATPAAPVTRIARRVRIALGGPRDVMVGFTGLATPGRDADTPPDTAEIATFYVHPAHWRRGAGHALMTAALVELAAAGSAAVTLWVLETNARAQAFYAAEGFTADGGRQLTGPGWPPEIRMRRALT